MTLNFRKQGHNISKCVYNKTMTLIKNIFKVCASMCMYALVCVLKKKLTYRSLLFVIKIITLSPMNNRAVTSRKRKTPFVQFFVIKQHRSDKDRTTIEDTNVSMH